MRRFWIAFAVCAAAATVPLLMTPVLPMADLPEHMAQVAIWKHMDDACHDFASTFELHLARPYLLGYGLARALATMLAVSAAFKVTVWLSIVLLPLALRALLARGAGDPWLALVGFLFAYGYSFYWGFLNFALAIPIALFYLAALYDTRPRHVRRVALAMLVLAAHALMFVFCALITMAVAAARRSWWTLLPVAPGAALFAAFALRVQKSEQAATAPASLEPDLTRVADLSSLLFANAWEPAGLLLAGAIIAAIGLTRPRVTRALDRWLLFAVAAAVYLAAPFGAYGSAYLYPRFAVMLAIGALFLFDEPRARSAVLRAVIVALVCAWMGVLAVRFHRFGAEVRAFEALLARMEPARRVAQFNVDPFSEHVPGPVFWHFGALYQVRRGGLSAWSFANYYPQIVRYRAGAEPMVKSRTTPVSGIDWEGVMQYDYLLLRGADPRRRMFRDAPAPLVLRARSGDWWLFETPRARTPQRHCPPLNE